MRIRSIVLFLICSAAVAQDKTPDFNLTGAGARAEGFGGAFIGLADDATAVVWNPAGLSQLERAEASVVTRVIGENSAYTDKADATFNSEEQQTVFNMNFGSVAIPLKSGGENNIVVAVAFQRQLDFSEVRRRDFEFEDNFNNEIKIRQRIEATGGVNTITPAIGVKLLPFLSLGMSANIWIGGQEREEIVVGTNGSTTLRDQTKFSSDFSGFNVVIGGMIDLEGLKSGPVPLKFGVTFRTPFTLSSEGDYDVDFESDPSVGKQRLAIEQDVSMPLMIGFGTSYRLGDNLTVAADYEIRSFSGNNIKTSAGGGAVSFSDRLSESDENLNQFRVGAEYLIVLDQGVIPLRAGFKTFPTVLADYLFNPVTEEYVATKNQVTGTGLAFGSGYISDIFALDLSVSMTEYTQQYAPFGEITHGSTTIGSSIIIYF